jgi:hypothetical protein
MRSCVLPGLCPGLVTGYHAFPCSRRVCESSCSDVLARTELQLLGVVFKSHRKTCGVEVSDAPRLTLV